MITLYASIPMRVDLARQSITSVEIRKVIYKGDRIESYSANDDRALPTDFYWGVYVLTDELKHIEDFTSFEHARAAAGALARWAFENDLFYEAEVMKEQS